VLKCRKYLVQFSSGPNVAFVEGFLIPGGNNYSSGFVPYQSPPPHPSKKRKNRLGDFLCSGWIQIDMNLPFFHLSPAVIFS
jgi:hypothetical protein